MFTNQRIKLSCRFVARFGLLVFNRDILCLGAKYNFSDKSFSDN